ncbi:MAG: hypothetical protein M3Y70_04020 [Pseudomonadota bacterium]|nr:hypothetical protein [Pseudomonadota bacterium]
MPLPPATVDDLGLQGCLSLWALVTAQERRLPLAPTRRRALAALEMLRTQGVIAVPWPQATWDANPAALETPIEGLQWQPTWDVYLPGQLRPALEEYLMAVDRDELAMVARLRLWDDLAAAEAEGFFAQQLTKHRLPGEWSADMSFAWRERTLTLAQWRYCGWAAVRRGASSMQQGEDPARVREVIYAELCQRALRLASGAWSNCALPPYHPTPGSALARGFLRLLAPLGMHYWMQTPNADVLSTMERLASRD